MDDMKPKIGGGALISILDELQMMRDSCHIVCLLVEKGRRRRRIPLIIFSVHSLHKMGNTGGEEAAVRVDGGGCGGLRRSFPSEEVACMQQSCRCAGITVLLCLRTGRRQFSQPARADVSYFRSIDNEHRQRERESRLFPPS